MKAAVDELVQAVEVRERVQLDQLAHPSKVEDEVADDRPRRPPNEARERDRGAEDGERGAAVFPRRLTAGFRLPAEALPDDERGQRQRSQRPEGRRERGADEEGEAERDRTSQRLSAKDAAVATPTNRACPEHEARASRGARGRGTRRPQGAARGRRPRPAGALRAREEEGAAADKRGWEPANARLDAAARVDNPGGLARPSQNHLGDFSSGPTLPDASQRAASRYVWPRSPR